MVFLHWLHLPLNNNQLTGGIGSGKTTVSNLFSKFDIEIIDADIAARKVVCAGSEGLKKIVAHFGEQILLADGQLNRGLLRSRIFSNPAEKSWLNALLHPLIRAQIIKEIKMARGNYCILSAPLLIENSLLELVDRLIVVDVDEETQIARTLKRDTSSKKEVQAIIDSQATRIERLNSADDIIDNSSSDISILKQQVTELDKKYRNLALQQKQAP